MKQITLSIVLFLIAGVLLAQKTVSFDDFTNDDSTPKENEVKTVMDSFSINRISGFGGSTMSFSSINGEFAVLNGGGGGILINNFLFGGYGEGMSSRYVQFEDKTSIREFGHGGFILGYELFPNNIIHPVITTRAGWGDAKGRYSSGDYFNQNVYVFTPAITAEVNLTRFCKVNIGAEYRQVLGAKGELKNSDLSNVGVYTSLVFGWF